jgi:hypothetical protein
MCYIGPLHLHVPHKYFCVEIYLRTVSSKSYIIKSGTVYVSYYVQTVL